MLAELRYETGLAALENVSWHEEFCDACNPALVFLVFLSC